MGRSNFLTVILISTVFYPHFSPASSAEYEQEPSTHESSEEEIFKNDPFFHNNQDRFFSPFQEPHHFRHGQRGVSGQRQETVLDPVLREIYEEEKRLNLAHGDDEFDMGSEEIRELINIQRRRINIMQNLARQAGAVVGIPQHPPQIHHAARSNRFQSQENSNDNIQRQHSDPPHPINDYSSPADSIITEERSAASLQTTTTSAPPPRVARMGIEGAFYKIKTGIDTAVGNFRNKLTGSSTKETHSTPSPSHSPSNNHVTNPGDDSKPFQPSAPVQQFNREEANGVASEGNDGGPLNCKAEQTEYNGTCYNVLQQHPCEEGQWLIEDDITKKGKCVENKCAHKFNHAYFDGVCVEAGRKGQTNHCHEGMVTYVFKNGDVECDCQTDYLYNIRDGNCYRSFFRGPCNSGEIFSSKTTQRGTLPASCMKSKCSEDGYFCNAPSCPNNRNCIKLGTQCPLGTWQISKTFTPQCLEDKAQPIIGNVPTLACAAGSRRDILGTCRKPSKFTFS